MLGGSGTVVMRLKIGTVHKYTTACEYDRLEDSLPHAITQNYFPSHHHKTKLHTFAQGKVTNTNPLESHPPI